MKSQPLILLDGFRQNHNHQCPAISFIIRFLLSGIFQSLLPEPRHCVFHALPLARSCLQVCQLSSQVLWSYVNLFPILCQPPADTPIQLFTIMSAPSPFNSHTYWNLIAAPVFKVSTPPLNFTHRSFSISLHLSGSVSEKKNTNHQGSIAAIYCILNYWWSHFIFQYFNNNRLYWLYQVRQELEIICSL